MPHDQQLNIADADIRLRSYFMWERDGRPDGKAEEHWLRAKAELEAEVEAHCHAAALEGETTAFVLPHVPISLQPKRSISAKVG
ncbi:MAG: DUF2934 domain-containing protein [Alphaproteobacteria bacterium]|nr:DUF2934 domain-containing protein [Alphaproteobacteria bacterium]MDE2496067.1 DUF2934 domain-containing protein [Alphaproteobacteria bacterium]